MVGAGGRAYVFCVSDESMVRCGEVGRSHTDLRQRAAQVAAGLRAAGIAAGERVAVMLRNSVEFLEISAGIGMAGAQPVPVNWHWRGQELGYLLADSGSRVLFVHAEFAGAARDALASDVRLFEDVRVIEVGVSPQAGASTAAAGDYEDWLVGHPPLVEVTESAGLGMIYTSGTTGSPKGIVRDRIAPEKLMALAGLTMTRMGIGPGTRTVIPAPLYHTAPNTLAMIALRVGADITLLPRFDPEDFLATVQRRRIEQVQMVPTMFVRLLRLPLEVRERYDLSSLQRIVHSAAPCPVPVKRAIIDWFGPIVHEYYGGSETGPVVWCDSHEWLAHPGTVGREIDGARVRIVGPDRRPVPVGEVGVVYVKPADYWPDFTYLGNGAKRREMELDGFVTVGDVGRMDADGFLYLTDRAGDMVISGGVNIYPAEIEAALSAVEGVRDIAVFGIPDEEFGESLAAHVDVDPAAGITEDSLRATARTLLAGYKVPKLIVFDDDLPREESGKLFKRRIRDRYWAGAARSI
jgi:long-chain acyl-CoA synthetase